MLLNVTLYYLSDKFLIFLDYVVVFENPPKKEEFLRNKIFFLENLVKIGLEIEIVISSKL